MDSLKFYDKKAEFDARLRDYMYSLYLKYWKFLKTLPCKERVVLDDYKGIHASLLNAILYFPTDVDFLRKTIRYHVGDKFPISSLPEVVRNLLTQSLNKIEILDKIFTKAPVLDKSIVVYRGLRGAIAKQIIKMRKGDELVMRGFNSTAFDYNVSLLFSIPGDDEKTVLRIFLPKGTPHLLLPGGPMQEYGEMTFKKMMETVQADNDQTELLLNRGTRLEIIGHQRHKISPKEWIYKKSYKTENFIYITNAKLLLDKHQTPQSLPSVDELVKEVAYLSFDTNPQPNGVWKAD